LSIRQATKEDLSLVAAITYNTIKLIYPLYYPPGAVSFFISHHREENIAADIASNHVFILTAGKLPIGTVTVKGIEICRLFVLPQYQRKGYGRTLIEHAEKIISEKSKKIRLDASLPAKQIYLKRGYREIETHAILTENGDYLFYDVMEKVI
jgi:GNAT superfamily N-acetyltransferase